MVGGINKSTQLNCDNNAIGAGIYIMINGELRQMNYIARDKKIIIILLLLFLTRKRKLIINNY